MATSDLRGKIQTVLGTIDPESLGPTLMHEHVICDITPPSMATGCCCDHEPITLENYWEIHYGTRPYPAKYRLDMVEVMRDEVARMHAAGGRAIVDLSNGGLKPDPGALAGISRDTGVHIVMGCGHYVEEYQDRRNFERSVDDFAAEMVAQVREGAWGTDVRAGIIGEIGCQAPWTELEKRVMRGAVLAQTETGAALNIHPGRHHDQPQEIVDFLVVAGADLSRTILSHIDRTIFDDERLFRVADSGAVIELDLFGIEQSFYPPNHAVDMPNDAERLRTVRRLVERGHIEQVLISHDICYRTRLRRFGGHGYSHIFENVVPLMRRRGFTEDEIDTILVDNPRRLLTFV
ncbi:MAG: aryldialkylphosphatase [Ectothiorhodospiraceae bacterium]|nr:aryldialkylphosphatase [Ectothiorhodospiraceae bacterium]